MRLIDDRGRLFGRLSIVDAAAIVVVCLVIPLIYGAYLLFKPPAPRMLAIEPARVAVGTRRVDVRGEHFRPALRVLVGRFGARFLLADAEHGVVDLPWDIPPGTYDVTLLDENQPVDTLPGALTIGGAAAAPPSTTALAAIGTFHALDEADAQGLWKALQAIERDDTRAWNIVGVASPERNVNYLPQPRLPLTDGRFQIRAVIVFQCTFDQALQCIALNTNLVQNALVPIAIDGGDRTIAFRISRLHPVYTHAVDVMLQSYMTPEEMSGAREELLPNGPPSISAAFEPSLESVEVRGKVQGNELIVVSRLRVPVVSTPEGWMYESTVLRTSETFVVSYRSRRLPGRIIGMGTPRPLSQR